MLRRRWFLLLLPIGLFAVLVSCLRPAPQANVFRPQAVTLAAQTQQAEASGKPTRDPNRPLLTPTPDQPRVLPTIQLEDELYYVEAGDALGKIAQRYGISVYTLIDVNEITDPNLLEIGQELIIPAPSPQPTGPDFKILPDSELVRGPASADFDIDAFVSEQGGYLNRYSETIDERDYTGAEVVERVATEYSVNPRLLLALLEYQSGWVTDPNPDEEWLDYPMRNLESWRIGLYYQLTWTANVLNRGFYLWQINAISHWLLIDGAVVPPASTINAGTAGLQYLLSQLYGLEDWKWAVSADGFVTTYEQFFGYPFDVAVEPLIPADLSQPFMQLPFEDGKEWFFTGGPHAGWGDGSGWAALDFAPPGEPAGCYLTEEWTTAVADGVVTYSDAGTVMLDLDGDGYDQTGWSVLYLHIDTYERARVGEVLQAGDRIGHPSCEGGVSNGTHVHMARRYNGMWISADGNIPFNLDGWSSQGAGSEYNGVLIRNDQTVEAWDRRKEENRIQR